MDYKYNVKPP